MKETQALPTEPAVAWHALTLEEVCRRLETSPKTGLADAEARLARFGPNRLDESEVTPPWKIFLAQFNDTLIIILIIAALVSGFLLKEWIDAAAIGVILMLNALLGFVQEYRAEHALAALKKLIAPQARVLRAGHETVIPAEQLVPGDVVLLNAGDRVPADVRLSEVKLLTVDESSLTGESLPVDKQVSPVTAVDAALGDRLNMAYSSTVITRGRAQAIVVATGRNTEMGKVVEMVAVTKDRTPLQNDLRVLGARIGYICLAVSALVLVSGLLRGHGWVEMFLVAISLAVAAIPEGLPAAVTVSLALGVKRMVGKNALVRRLHAVETLGSTSFICSDKTGTITINKMRVEQLAAHEKLYSRTEVAEHAGQLHDLLRCGALCNDVRRDTEGRVLGDPLEIALLVSAEEAGFDPLKLDHSLPRVAEIPFEAERKAMTTIHKDHDHYLVLVKGAPEVMFAACTTGVCARWLEINHDLTGRGYRTIAFAQKVMDDLPDKLIPAEIESGLTFLGLAAISDPPREEVKAAIRTCHRAGIKVAMITGDHRLTAESIGREVGLLEPGTGATQVLAGPELEAMSDEQLALAAETVRVYARVSPLQKVRIVKALKGRGYTVAMTGDGVNDAPALKLSSIGVAMGITGTDVAKESADMILMDDNFATIVAAVGEGRTIFANLKKFIYFLLSCNIGEVMGTLMASLAGWPILAPIEILWMNLVTDGPPALALGIDPADEDLMNQPPRNVRKSILSGDRIVALVIQGAILTVGVLAVYLYAQYTRHLHDPEQFDNLTRTAAFLTMVMGQKFHVFNFRVGNRFLFSKRLFANRWLILAVLGTSTLQFLLIYLKPLNAIFETVPLPPDMLIVSLLSALIPVIIINIARMLRPERV